MKKRRKSETLLLPGLLKKIGANIGAKVLVEPEWGVVGQITFKNGRRRYFRYNTLDLNRVGASDVAKDKDYANFFMKKMGYPTVEGRSFHSDAWCAAIGSKRNAAAALLYARKLGFPVFAKPNSGSHGNNVYRCLNERELRAALKKIFIDDRIALVQRPVAGSDYRVVVLDNDVISAYQRIPLNVVGNGKSTIMQLLKKKQQGFEASSRDTSIKLNDPRIANKLRHLGLSFTYVPRRDERVYVLDNANLSSGGDAVDVTEVIHPTLKKLCIKLTRDMGLRLCGVDIMIDGSISEDSKKYSILEINAAPGLDHYVKTGGAQKKIVEEMYLRVLKAME